MRPTLYNLCTRMVSARPFCPLLPRPSLALPHFPLSSPVGVRLCRSLDQGCYRLSVHKASWLLRHRAVGQSRVVWSSYCFAQCVPGAWPHSSLRCGTAAADRQGVADPAMRHAGAVSAVGRGGSGAWCWQRQRRGRYGAASWSRARTYCATAAVHLRRS